MIYLVIIGIIGLGLGVFSFFEQKLFLGLMLLSFVAVGVFGRLLFIFSGIMVSETSPAGQSEGLLGDIINLYAAIYNFMPSWAQLGLWVLPAAIVSGRLLTWTYYTAVPGGGVTHTEADKRAKTIANFSYKRNRHGR